MATRLELPPIPEGLNLISPRCNLSFMRTSLLVGISELPRASARGSRIIDLCATGKLNLKCKTFWHMDDDLNRSDFLPLSSHLAKADSFPMTFKPRPKGHGNSAYHCPLTGLKNKKTALDR